VNLAAAHILAVQPEIGEILITTTNGKRYRRTTATTPAVDGNYEEIASISAADLVNVPAGGIAAVTVQGAINEMDTEKGNRAGITVSTVALVGAGALAAHTTADETLAIAGLPVNAVILGIDLSATAIAGCTFGQARNNGAGSVIIRYNNCTAAPIAVAADAAVRVAWFAPTAW
jgi:predicted nucleic acid-binding protein